MTGTGGQGGKTGKVASQERKNWLKSWKTKKKARNLRVCLGVYTVVLIVNIEEFSKVNL